YPGNLSIKILDKEIFNSLYIFDEPKEINFTNEINSFLFNSSGEMDNYSNEIAKFQLNISGEIGKIRIYEPSIKYFYRIKIHFENELNNYLVGKSGIVDFPIKISFGSKGRIILTGLDLVYNVKPEIISIPPKNAVVGSEYKYEIIAVDYDNDNLSYSLEKYPDGMTIEENVLKFTPKINQTDSHEVVVVVDDSNGGICKQNFSIFVKKENSKPTINSTPIENCFVNVTYIYKVNATDLDNDTLKFNLLESPKDMSIDENNGTISWLPEVKGTYYVRIEVNDSYSSVYQEFNITVRDKNNPPIIKSKANETAIQGILYEYIIIAEDLDNDNLTYKIIYAPNGMKKQNNKISWLPLSIGDYPVKIEVSDGYDIVNQSFKINVLENSKPIIKSIPKKNLKVGERYKYKVIAEDEEGREIKYSLAVFPKGMEIDENGTIVWIPNKAGEYRVVVNVSDGFGNASQEFYIKVEESFDIQILFLSIIFLILLFAFAYVAKKYSKKKVERIAIVEDIFVVYNDGRLIFHESRRLKPELDSDTISSMLTAIQNFVKDAFVGGEEAKLGSFEYGKNKVVMEYGEYTILAIVISGLESSELRRKMRNAVIEIELKYSDVIRKWNGDLGKFDGISKLIEDYRFG
ncbi:MAG: putative Ig domain-containing protein, partial [Candidatus Thermoplasmatota archaeon]